MNKPLVVAVVGTGFMAQTHLSAYTKLANARVKYVVGRRPGAAAAVAARVGAEGVDRLGQALEDPSVDLIDITVPTPLHPEFVIAALRAGKHVIVEKPIALNPALADEMIAAARQSGKSLMVAHVLRFWPVYQRISELVRSNVLGRALHARAYRLASPPQWASWLSDRTQTGGAAVDLGIHDIDFMNSIFGAPKSVQAWGTHSEGGIALHYVASIEYEGLVAFSEASMAMPEHYPFTAGIQVHLEGGVVEHHFRAAGASFEDGEAVDTATVTATGRPAERLALEQHDPFERQLGHFLETVIDKEEKLIVTAEDARLALAVSDSINKSVRIGQRVEI